MRSRNPAREEEKLGKMGWGGGGGGPQTELERAMGRRHVQGSRGAAHKDERPRTLGRWGAAGGPGRRSLGPPGPIITLGAWGKKVTQDR